MLISSVKNWIKKNIGTDKVIKTASKLSNYPLVVLTYHDVCKDDDFSSWLRVRLTDFENQIKELKKYCNFLKPEDLFKDENLSKDRLNLLVTFDDGFVNNYKLVFPFLKRYEIPALFFISTSHVQSGESFWFDKIITPIQSQSISSINLRHLGLREYNFSASNESERWDKIQDLLVDIKAIGNPSDTRVQNIISFFEENFTEDVNKVLYNYRPLNEHEIYEMHSSGICFFGSHSLYHEILTLLGKYELRKKLISSKLFLEKLLGYSVVHIAYPNGDADMLVKSLSMEVGYKFGYIAVPGLIDKKTDRMSIPRILIGGYDSVQTIMWKLSKQLLYNIVRL